MPSLTRDELSLLDSSTLAAEIAADIKSDFIIAPHFDVLLQNDGETFVNGVLEGLESGYPGPRPPLHILVPKARGHFRPGALLQPEDRVVYHAISALAFHTVEAFDGDRAFSRAERSLSASRGGTKPPAEAWTGFESRRDEITASSEWVLELDIAHYFERIQQHDLVNLLEAEGLSANAKNLTDHFLQAVRMRDSSGRLTAKSSNTCAGLGFNQTRARRRSSEPKRLGGPIPS